MERLKRGWKTFKLYVGWDDIIAIVLLVIGVVGFLTSIPYIGQIPYVIGWTDFYLGIRFELIGIGITVLLIGNASQMMGRREEKRRLILQMGSPDNTFAREAVRQLRTLGWLSGGSLRGARLMEADLRGANLWQADLRGVRLTNADLRGANLMDADLRIGILWNVDLKEANLIRSNLRSADLSGANLEGSLMMEANLENSLMHDANLKGANVNDEQLVQVFSLEGATMPDGKLYDGRFDKKEGEE